MPLRPGLLHLPWFNRVLPDRDLGRLLPWYLDIHHGYIWLWGVFLGVYLPLAHRLIASPRPFYEVGFYEKTGRKKLRS